MELCEGRDRLGVRKSFFTSREVGGHGTGSPGQWAWPQVSKFKEHSDITFRHRFEFWWCCVEPGVGHDEPCGSLPTQSIL